MKFSDEQIEDLTIALFEDADQGNRGAITFDALKNQLEKHEGLLENLTTRLVDYIIDNKIIKKFVTCERNFNNFSIDRWLVPPKPELESKSFVKSLKSILPYQLTKPYLKNNYVYITFISIFVLINAALFFTRIYQYRKSNVCIAIARACGNYKTTKSPIYLRKK